MNLPRSETPSERSPIRALIGPTASGKSRLALEIAARAGAEIVSLDSMQVYRRMDIGTAKPTSEERARVRHHMLDLVEPDERYDASRFLGDVAPVLADIEGRGARALCVGGTGFYLKVLLDGLFSGPEVDPALRADLNARAARHGNAELHAELARVDPESARRIHVNDTKRVVRGLEVFLQTGRPLSAWQVQWNRAGARDGQRARLVGLNVPSDVLDARIRARAADMLEHGFAREAAAIRAHPGFGPTSSQALGYAEALAVHDGTLAADEALTRITLRTRQFARRQRTWYRHFPAVTWLEGASASATESARRGPPESLVAAASSALGW